MCEPATFVRSMLCVLYCRYGGALYIIAPYLVIEQCLFENNAASSNGGAIYIFGAKHWLTTHGQSMKRQLSRAAPFAITQPRSTEEESTMKAARDQMTECFT